MNYGPPIMTLTAIWEKIQTTNPGSMTKLSSIVEPFEDVIDLKGDPDDVSISKRDVELLQPETFINDTLIDFYLKYLKNKVQLENKHRFHFSNSFFFHKLADPDKDAGNVKEGRGAFLHVRKWTWKINIFGKDYIFIPVNFK
ncbi:probable ubiquitin-like-specific protease 2B [Magnolia sinica]|uniref:probable ubiquitin-like-specific protease 2B n=1 Tax=Magnolia sinica TaxID=86752 RepID=UPI00265B51CE|nr:probable ubiquitin-like-specific protease 2B [Magnolia sinica]